MGDIGGRGTAWKRSDWRKVQVREVEKEDRTAARRPVHEQG